MQFHDAEAALMTDVKAFEINPIGWVHIRVWRSRFHSLTKSHAECLDGMAINHRCEGKNISNKGEFYDFAPTRVNRKMQRRGLRGIQVSHRQADYIWTAAVPRVTTSKAHPRAPAAPNYHQTISEPKRGAGYNRDGMALVRPLQRLGLRERVIPL
jgi:hypothetical protein